MVTSALGNGCLRSTCLTVSTAKAASNDWLLVANKGSNSLGIIDPVAGQQVVQVPEGGVTGHEVISSPDGKLAYVPIYGNSGVGQPGIDGTNMVVIDLASRKVVGNLEFGKGVRPHCPKFGPKNGLLYISTELDHSISIVDPATLKIIGTIPTSQAESTHVCYHQRRPPRIHGKCRTGHGFCARYGSS
jgi:DNA-binding beta-propeller fold protein YncE